ncbi:MAG: iron-containing alcohol dehydrogenase [Thermoprotei archaeon]
MNFSFYLPTRIVFGRGSLSSLGEEAKRLNAAKALVVTDKTMVSTGILDKVLSQLGPLGYTVFDAVEAEPRIEVAEQVAAAVRGSEFNLVIGVGGGSSLDMAKVAACMATNPGSARNYVGQNLFSKRGLPSIMIPTTAGTGSEVTVTSMVTVEGRKQWVNSPHLLPTTALVDPELTFSMPKKVTAATGLDALAHCVEAYLSTIANTITDLAALEGVRLIAANLVHAYREGSPESREAMSLAALLGGIALAAKAVYGHSVGYTIGTRFGLPHGVSVAVPLPYIASNCGIKVADKMGRLAQALGVNPAADNSKTCLSIASKIREIVASVDVPTTLKEVGVTEQQLPVLAEECVTTFYRANSPVVFDSRTMSELYSHMWAGDLNPLPSLK